MAESTLAELQKQLDSLQAKIKEQGGAPLDSNIVPLAKPIDPKGMNKQLVAQLEHTYFRPGEEKDGVSVTVAVKVDGAAHSQTAVLKSGTWVLSPKSQTAADLAGEASTKDLKKK